MRSLWAAIVARLREPREERAAHAEQIEATDAELVRKDEVIDTLRRSRLRDEHEIRQMRAIARGRGGKVD